MITYLGKRSIFVTALACLLKIAVFPQNQPDSTASIQDKIVKETAAILKKGQYMVQGQGKEVKDLDGWKGFVLTWYDYEVDDKSSIQPDKKTKASVILYNPSPELWVKWVINALSAAGKRTSYNNIKTVIDYINSQSNAQFPVRGIVYEDLDCSDGIPETYTFVDGVSVKITGAEVTTYKKGTCDFTKERLSTDQNTFLLNLKPEQVDLVKYPDEEKHKGRISSTTRKEYKAAFPDYAKTYPGIDINTSQGWVYIVRKEYQNAITTGKNNLIYATIRQKDGLPLTVSKTVNGKKIQVDIIRKFEE